MSDNVVRLLPTKSTETPEERGRRMVEIVTLPDGRQKRYGALNFIEHTALLLAHQAELADLQAELAAAEAAMGLRALQGDAEAIAYIMAKEDSQP
jgi:hypothetical protein